MITPNCLSKPSKNRCPCFCWSQDKVINLNFDSKNKQVRFQGINMRQHEDQKITKIMNSAESAQIEPLKILITGITVASGQQLSWTDSDRYSNLMKWLFSRLFKLLSNFQATFEFSSYFAIVWSFDHTLLSLEPAHAGTPAGTCAGLSEHKYVGWFYASELITDDCILKLFLGEGIFFSSQPTFNLMWVCMKHFYIPPTPPHHPTLPPWNGVILDLKSCLFKWNPPYEIVSFLMKSCHFSNYSII